MNAKKGIKRIGRLLKTAVTADSDIQDIDKQLKAIEEEVKQLEELKKQQNKKTR